MVSSPKGLVIHYHLTPGLQPVLSAVEGCWATIVTPLGLRIDARKEGKLGCPVLGHLLA